MMGTFLYHGEISPSYLFLVALVSLYPGLIQTTSAAIYPCNETWQEYQGYTFSLDEYGQRIWTHCGFPNPLYDQISCGWPTTDLGTARYLCDPDNLLNEADAITIDTKLKDFNGNSARQCGDQNSFAAFVIVNKTRIPDVNSADVCINTCGEIQPTLVPSSVPSTDDMKVISENFASNVRKQWKLGSCQNDMVILYWYDQGQLQISYGDNIPYVVTMETMTNSLDAALSTLQQNDSSAFIAVAMTTMLKSFQPTFSLTQPATILFILNFAVMIIVAMFLFAFTNMGKKEYDVWGVELHWEILGKGLYYLSGLWIIELIFKGILWVQNQSLWVVLIFPITMCLLCVIGFLIFILQ